MLKWKFLKPNGLKAKLMEAQAWLMLELKSPLRLKARQIQARSSSSFTPKLMFSMLIGKNKGWTFSWSNVFFFKHLFFPLVTRILNYLRISKYICEHDMKLFKCLSLVVILFLVTLILSFLLNIVSIPTITSVATLLFDFEAWYPVSEKKKHLPFVL